MAKYLYLRNILLLFYVFNVSVHAGTFENFSKVNLSHEYVDVLSKLEIELDSGGAKIVELPNGSVWVVGVGLTVVNPVKGGKEIIRQKIVATNKAKKNVLEALKGEYLAASTTTTHEAKVKVIDGIESGESVEDYNQRIETSVQGVTKGLKQAGTWYSQDGQIFYLALCNRLK